MSTLAGLVRATHAMPTLAVTAFATAIGVAAGIGPRAVLLAAAVLTGQASVGWCNDYVDAERDRRAHRVEKPIVSGAVPERLVGACAAVALVACVPLSLLLGVKAAAAHLVAVGAAWLYDLRLKETSLSALPYAVAFALLPVVAALALPGTPLPRWPLVVAGAVLGVAAHFANTVGDERADRLTRVHGLPQRLGPDGSTLLASGLVAAAASLLLLAAGVAPLPVLAVLASVAVAASCPVVVLRLGRRDAAFRMVLGAVALLVAAFVVSGGGRLVS